MVRDGVLMAGDWFSSDVETLDLTIITAEAVELDDVETFIVAFAVDEFGEQFSLGFEVGLEEPDDQDRRLKQDGYCVVDHCGGTVYEGVTRWSADAERSLILLEFTAEAVEILEVPTQVRMDLKVDRQKFDRLVLGLERVFTSYLEVGRQPVRIQA
jgi:hypothetical protein